MKGREISGVLRRLSTATFLGAVATGSAGCESVFHWCMNGQYGAPYYARDLREIPESASDALRGATTSPIDAKVCASLCGSPDAEHCELASVAEPSAADRRFVVCFAYRENGCPSGWGSGRVPDGLLLEEELASEPRHARTLGDYFARAAALEAASVVSFRRLAADLTRYGAPGSLVRRSERAAMDEKHHATLARRLARRWGGARTRARIAPAVDRTLRDLAIENAWSGCVGETFGALLLAMRAHVCDDREVRDTLRRMARDEVAHAALAWDIRAWLLERLDPIARVEERVALRSAARAAARVSFDPVFPFDPRPIARALDSCVWRAA